MEGFLGKITLDDGRGYPVFPEYKHDLHGETDGFSVEDFPVNPRALGIDVLFRHEKKLETIEKSANRLST